MNKCSGGQPRYKGIENFLRRLAFNIGNSPSQTDVKIISCIPIDVTDLHQKVIYLEKELQEKMANDSNNVNELYPVTVNHNPHINSPDSVSIDQMLPSSIKNVISAATKTDHQTKKKLKQLFKTQQHLVYHARTDTPLNFTANFRRNTNKLPTSRSSHSSCQYIDKDRTSEISTPICRDLSNHEQKYAPNESDSCSCCHGNFANIDDHIEHYCFVKNCDVQRVNVDANKSRRYYDSSLYDLVPVRDNIKPRKTLKEATKRINEVYKNMEILNMREHVDHRSKMYPTASKRNRPSVSKGVTVNVEHITETRKSELIPSQTCYIDCGQIYAKKSSQRNGSGTTNNNDQPDKLGHDDEQTINNEKCLNEIKSILQNVLQEIKTTAKDKVEVAATRSSYGKHPCGLGACGPYGAGPYQLASCSLSFPSPGLCPAVPYMHPVMMPAAPPVPPVQLCDRHLRRATESDESAQSSPDKTSAGTSTSDRDQSAPPAPAQHAQPAPRTNETDLLIREIYKCLSLDSGESAGGGGRAAGGGEVGSSERRFVSQSGTHSALDRISEIAEKESRVDLTSGESASSGSDVTDRKPQVKDPSSSKAKNFISKILNFLKKKKPNKGDSESEDSEANSDDEYTTIYSERLRPGDVRQPPTKIPAHLYKYKREQETRRQLAGSPARPVYWQNVEARPALLRYTNKTRERNEQPPKLRIHDKPLNSKVKLNKNTGLTWLKKYKSGVRQCGRHWTKYMSKS